MIHPAFRDAYHQAAAISANSCMLQTASGDVSAASGPHQSPMEIDQITSLVSIFSFGQQLFNTGDNTSQSTPVTCPVKKTSKEDDDSDSDSDTSSDSGHSSDDHETNAEPPDCDGSRTCLAAAKDKDLDVTSVSVAAAV